MPRAVKIFCKFLFLSLLLHTIASRADARREIAVLLSKDLSVYRRTLARIRERVESKCSLKTFVLADSLSASTRLRSRLEDYPFDCILGIGTRATLLGMEVRGQRPLISSMTLYPSRLGDEKEKNIHLIPYLPPAKSLARELSNICPGTKDLGLLWMDDSLARLVRKHEAVLDDEGFRLHCERLQSQEELPQKLDSIARNCDAFLLLPEPALLQKDALKYLLITLLERQKPVITFSPSIVKSGALFSLSYSSKVIAEQTASLLLDCLEDGDADIALPEAKLTVNKKVARFLGIELPRQER